MEQQTTLMLPLRQSLRLCHLLQFCVATILRTLYYTSNGQDSLHLKRLAIVKSLATTYSTTKVTAHGLVLLENNHSTMIMKYKLLRTLFLVLSTTLESEPATSLAGQVHSVHHTLLLPHQANHSTCQVLQHSMIQSFQPVSKLHGKLPMETPKQWISTRL